MLSLLTARKFLTGCARLSPGRHYPFAGVEIGHFISIELNSIEVKLFSKVVFVCGWRRYFWDEVVGFDTRSIFCARCCLPCAFRQKDIPAIWNSCVAGCGAWMPTDWFGSWPPLTVIISPVFIFVCIFIFLVLALADSDQLCIPIIVVNDEGFMNFFRIFFKLLKLIQN